MAPSRRETRSRTSSPYAGRPEPKNKASSQSGKSPATPKTKQAQHEPSSRHRYGLRSMLSNLIWGSPVKAVEEESESGEEIDTDGDEDEDNHMSRLLSPRSDKQTAQIISDDEDEEEPQTQPSTASTFDSAPSRRFTAAEKGKGSPHRTDSYSAAKYLPSSSGFGSGLRSSQTFGDMRSIQRDINLSDNIETSTPNTSTALHQEENLPSPGDVNSQLANFFAAKGTASLTADERRRISEILLGNTSSAASADHNVPTALTPNFSFHVPVPSAIRSHTSVLPHSNKGIQRSSTTSGGLSSLASRATGGLTGSQSLSSLSSLAAGSGGPPSAAANPRSALNRRQARPLYLGAGYSSQAIARRKRVQTQMTGLYSNLTSFDSTSSTAGPSALATPGKRRRVGEEAETSTSVAASGPARSAIDQANAPPTFSLENSTPLTSTPGPPRASQQPALFGSAPHLKAQFASTPAKPSPLRAAAVATPSPPAKAAEPSPPKSMSKTASLMRGIVGDTSEPAAKKSVPSAASASGSTRTAPPSITMTRTSKPTTKVPREELIKRAEPPTAAEILERSMPPELRHTPNGKQPRPRPPPVPGSARKTRASSAAEAGGSKGKGNEQAKESLHVPPTTRRGRSKSKTPEGVSQLEASSSKSHAEATTKLAAGDSIQDGPAKQTSVSDDMETDAPPEQSKKAAFNFGSGAPATPAPSFFGTGPIKSGNTPAVIEQPAPSKPLFSFAPPPAQSTPISQASSKSTTPSASVTEDNTKSSGPAFSSLEKSPNSFALTTLPFDAKQEALKVPTVSLPTFTLFDTGFSFNQAAGDVDGEDAGIKSIKQTVLEIPKNELVTFDLL